ncbi:MAG: cytidylyltransferase domain-containing protein, partial [Nitrospinota bacterium]
LPGKVLKKVLGKTLLEYHLERIKLVPTVDEVVVATTVNDTDNPIVELCEQTNTAYYRGSEPDVLSRYYDAAKHFNADVVMRVTSDCPLIDPAEVEKVLQLYMNNFDRYDYVSNFVNERTYPRGMEAEIFPFRLLEEASRGALEPRDREHVTTFIYERPERFRLGGISYGSDESRYRLTVDTEADFELVGKIIENLYPAKKIFSMRDVLELMRENPEWELINKHIKQKF